MKKELGLVNTDDRKITPQEHAEIIRRKAEMEVQKQAGAASPLAELRQELGLPENHA